ncbi:MAG: nucleoside hydrolase [Dehalococcoidia bacterium]|nr:MAG: nucleoside hydrolase [Dehalococcoidia bacterium]
MRKFPELPKDVMLARLEPPAGRVRMVLDTDTYNEIDDQFALVYALFSKELEVEAIYAAPFLNQRSKSPADGMIKSYEEIRRILELLNVRHDNYAFRGSEEYLTGKESPVSSDAAADLVERAMTEREQPLYVVAIGAITNIASAILIEPRIIERIIVVWLGGMPYYWHTARHFNLQQDLKASQLIFDSGVPLVHIPTKNVAEHVRTTLPEVERYVKGQGIIGDYLHWIFSEYTAEHFASSKVIWDITTIAFLLNAEWVPSVICPSPILTDSYTWSFDQSRHPTRVAIDARRDAIFGDLFKKLCQ